ncbi:MAG: ROK family protein [Chloroflexi bacterium]|nr:ROK family protein [Chloroflexota bacterium]
MKIILGIDIGGSGVKGAPVKIKKGILAAERYRIPTPQPSTPDAVGDTVAQIAKHFDWKRPIGCTFPAVVKKGIVYSAANVDKSWIGVDGSKLLKKKTGCPVVLINDADAAGIAEMKYGIGRLHTKKGIIFLLTLGTGIGSAIFVNGVLMPNTELGHMEMKGMDAEHYASAFIRKKENLDWDEWATRVNEYLNRLEVLFSPDLFILGGGVSKRHEKFLHLLHTQAQVVPAQLRNNAGIVGAALAAKDMT